MKAPAHQASSPHWIIVCLCAQWCGTCRDYQQTFQGARALFLAQQDNALSQAHWQWIDIEDDADWIGDIDVETFPTLLVGYQNRGLDAAPFAEASSQTQAFTLLFAGPILPHIGDIEKRLQSLSANPQAYAQLQRTVPSNPLTAVYQNLIRQVAAQSGES